MIGRRTWTACLSPERDEGTLFVDIIKLNTFLEHISGFIGSIEGVSRLRAPPCAVVGCVCRVLRVEFILTVFVL